MGSGSGDHGLEGSIGSSGPLGSIGLSARPKRRNITIDSEEDPGRGRAGVPAKAERFATLGKKFNPFVEGPSSVPPGDEAKGQPRRGGNMQGFGRIGLIKDEDVAPVHRKKRDGKPKFDPTVGRDYTADAPQDDPVKALQG